MAITIYMNKDFKKNVLAKLTQKFIYYNFIWDR